MAGRGEGSHYSELMAKVYAKKISAPGKPYKHLMLEHYHNRFWGKYQEQFQQEAILHHDSILHSMESSHNQSLNSSLPHSQASFMKNLERLGDNSQQLARQQLEKKKSEKKDPPPPAPSILQ